MYNIFLCYSACVLLATQGWATDGNGGNPIVPGVGLADPHGVVYGNKVYLYATHDFSIANKGFCMKDWWIWSSTDLVTWIKEGILDPKDTCLRRSDENCWAGYGVSRNGKYYWYVSLHHNSIAVVVSDTPNGPWRDPIGKPLIPIGMSATEARDPGILIDDNDEAYIVYGTYDFFIGRLGRDMISLAETPRLVSFDRKAGPYGEGKTDDKPNLHKRNGIYYLSWGCYYATSSNIYGPYTYKGSVIAPDFQAPEFRKHFDQDRHGNFFEFNNQWYYVFNDFSQPGSSGLFRNSCLAYVHYRDNGDMAPVRINRIGVGQYDASEKIEAECYFDAPKNVVKMERGSGFEMRNIRNGDVLSFPKVRNMQANTPVNFLVASGNPEGGAIEIRSGSKNGKILGTCKIPNTGGWTNYRLVSCNLMNDPGTNDICLVFKGNDSELTRLDWFKCGAKPQDTAAHWIWGSNKKKS